MSLSSSLRGSGFPLLISCSLLLAACGEELTDGDFGGVDLQQFYFDSGGAIPKVTPTEGWWNGQRAMYYDFGWAAATRDTADPETRSRLDIDSTKTVPKVAPVNPMYFFFDGSGNPLFSVPVREKKTGYYFMAGGKGVRNVNPSAKASRDVAYPVRQRDLLIDPNRKVADYQRPVIDVIFDRNKPPLQQRYTGLWEVVAVQVPSGYDPDAIKSWDLLEKGWDKGNGDFKITQTEAVINCPIIDPQSQFLPSVSAFPGPEPRRIPQPRVELWYRRKRVDCYLVNGWPSLGETIAKPGGDDEYRLYKSTDADNKKRFSVLDTDRFVLGEGIGQRRQMVAPLGQIFVPALSARDDRFYLETLVTSGALPKQKKDDPNGYRPIRWWWDIAVTDVGREVTDANFAIAGLTDPRAIDTASLYPRNIDNGGVVMNIALTSQEITCPDATPENDPCTELGLVCSKLQGETRAICQEKKVRYGEFCGPTIAQCRQVVSPTDKTENWFQKTGPGATNIPEGLPQEWLDAVPVMSTTRPLFNGVGLYGCLADPVSQFGHCYLQCSGGVANTLQGAPPLEIEQTTRSGRTIKTKYLLDSRCGGALMPGFRCMPVRDLTNESGGSWCLRDCQSSEGQDVTDRVCGQPTPMYFSDAFFGTDAALNTRCLDSRLIESQDEFGRPRFFTFDACIKDAAYSPYEGE